jgi:glycine cleavage system H protein
MRTLDSLLYSAEHLWTKPVEDGMWQAGITDYAQDLLGDIVFVDAPPVGAKLIAGQPCGLVESVKTGSDLHALVDGEVVAINQDIVNSPELINDDPYKAWIFKFKPALVDVKQQLLTATEYQVLVDGL